MYISSILSYDILVINGTTVANSCLPAVLFHAIVSPLVLSLSADQLAVQDGTASVVLLNPAQPQGQSCGGKVTAHAHVHVNERFRRKEEVS